MRRAAGDEKAAARAELDAHMEDRICALMELGYDEDLATERTVAAMGDPEEVGRELDKQCASPIWDKLEVFAAILLVVLFLQSATGLGILFHAWDSMVGRIAPEQKNSNLSAEIREDVDIRIPVGNDILRIYQVVRGERKTYIYSTGEYQNVPTAVLTMCAYDRIPCGVVSDEIHKGLSLFNERGEKLEAPWDNGGAGTGSYGAEYLKRYVPIEPEDTYVTLVYDRFGETFSQKIPLPEVSP